MAVLTVVETAIKPVILVWRDNIKEGIDTYSSINPAEYQDDAVLDGVLK